MNPKTVCIIGDIANDYFLVRGKRFFSDDKNQAHKGTQYCHHKGGAYLIYKFLKTISESGKPDSVKDQLKPEFGYCEDVFDTLPGKNKGYVSVSQFEKENVWRIDEFFGYGDSGNKVADLTKNQVPVNSDTDIFIIDDAGMDFSSEINKAVWNSLIETIKSTYAIKSDSLLIYKKSSDFDDSDFYDTVLKASSEKLLNLLTIISINDIRKLDVKVSSGLSWEQSALDLVAELKTNTVLSSLLKSKYLVITFQSSGALFVVNNGNDNFEYTLIFDPENMEGEDEDPDCGSIIGRMSFFTAAFVSRLNLAKKDKFYLIENAIKAGLTAIRLFYEKGYLNSGDGGIDYPFIPVAEALNNLKEYSFSSASVPDSDIQFYDRDREWSILIDNYSKKQIKEEVQIKALTALAKNIVLRGSEILKNVPSGRFGKLCTIDRMEIESLRNLKKIMKTYVNQDEGKKPLSIGVFGPPGAGKSFAVEEISQGIMGNRYNLVSFNLSQFNDSDDLIGALHQVRDCVLRKKIPVVFWDEFDSQGYKWLQYLLAPMQDGVFQEGQITHPVGKCIFVFAGATSYSMDSFGKFKTEDAQRDFILKKGPDFMSRLNGYINILGPNKRQLFDPDYTKEEEKWVDDPTDLTYPVRRAMFITGLLRLKKTDYPFNMDWGLLNALIKVDRYKHGSRSLVNLLTDIRQNNPRNLLLRSWLPSKPTLELYFKDANNFYECMTREEDFLEKAWEIAPLFHSYWMNKINDPMNELSVEYSFLPVFIKESNVMAAKRVPEVLESGGLKLTRKDASEKLRRKEYAAFISENDNALLEKMAEKEHSLWMDFYIEHGWEHAPFKNNYSRKHPCIKPYNELDEVDKAKDREIVSNYPDIVDKAEFGIAKL